MRIAQALLSLGVVTGFLVGAVLPGSAFAAVNTGRIAINRNATHSPSRVVTLQLSRPADGATHMRLSNSGTRWTEWKPFQATYRWNFVNYTGGTAAEGTKRVHVSFRNGATGAEVRTTDTAIYNPRKVKALSVSRFHYDAKGNDNYNLNDEYVVLKNNLRGPLGMTGWKLRDGQSHEFVVPPFSLGGDKNVTVYTGSGGNSSARLFWRNDAAIWNNEGDALKLYTQDGYLILLKTY